MKTLFYLSCVGLLISSCQNEAKEPLAVTQHSESAEATTTIQPLPGLEVEIRKFKVIATENSTIELPNGGSIVFPANSLVDANGNLVSGEVDIEWQEFHSLTDILLSGIPMKYDSLGKEHDFVSGGMFTINASQKGNEIDLAEGKTATVNLASYDDTPCYNFYKLDEKSGDWSYRDTQLGTSLEEEKANKKPQKQTDVNQSNVLDVSVNVSAFPELVDQTIVGWESLQPIDAKTRSHLVNRSNVVKLIKEDKGYALEVRNKEGTVNVPVKPYTLDQANQQRAVILEKQERDYKELLAYQENVAKGKVVRSIEIDGMGTYNWDKILVRQQEVILAAAYQFPEEHNKNLMTVFFVSPEENVVIQCNAKGDYKFKFDPEKKNFLVAVSKDNEVLLVNDRAFAQARAHKSGSHTFAFQSTGMVAESPEDVGQILKEVIKG